jgi:NitT/TauT family transport system ATP-binding protein
MHTFTSHSVPIVGETLVEKDTPALTTEGAPTSGRVEIAGLSFGYATSDHYIIKSLNLKIEPGEAISLLGPSGCGKSTLLHLIAGLSRPQSGRILLDGDPISKPSPRCNLMLQQATLYPWLNVFKNTAFGLRLGKKSRKEIRDIVMPLLELVKLDQLAKRNVRKLSGGQQQRVALARSLATSPAVMLLDEPFSALDSFTRIELQNEIRDICKRRGITLIVVTHDFDEAIRMSDRILMMTNRPSGDIVAEIPNHTTFEAGRTEEAIAFQRARLTSLWENHIKN